MHWAMILFPLNKIERLSLITPMTNYAETRLTKRIHNTIKFILAAQFSVS